MYYIIDYKRIKHRDHDYQFQKEPYSFLEPVWALVETMNI